MPTSTKPSCTTPAGITHLPGLPLQRATPGLGHIMSLTLGTMAGMGMSERAPAPAPALTLLRAA